MRRKEKVRGKEKEKKVVQMRKTLIGKSKRLKQEIRVTRKEIGRKVKTERERSKNVQIER